MHKRLLLSLLLTGQLWARPSATLEQLDHRLPVLPTAAVRQRLDQAEVLFARQSDWNHLLEARCRRAELLFYERDPSFPTVLTQLRQDAERVPQGSGRGWYYWILASRAGYDEDWVSARKWGELALQQPVSPLTRLGWLERMVRHQGMPEDAGLARWVMDQARALQEQIPGDEAAYAWMEIQTGDAKTRGLTDLTVTLRTAMAEMARRNHWTLEEVRCLGALGGKAWPRILALIQGLPEGSLRNQLSLRLIDFAPDLRTHRTLLKLARRADPAEVLWKQLLWSTRAVGLRETTEDQRQSLGPRVIQAFHSQGKIESEIMARSLWANYLRLNQQPRAAERHLQAALQMRRDHPLADPGWGANPLAGIGLDLALVQGQQTHLLQELATTEGLLGNDVPATPSQRSSLHHWATLAAGRLGDLESKKDHIHAEIELLDSLPPVLRAARLSWLVKQEGAPRRAELLAQFRVLSEQRMQNAPAGEARWAVLDDLLRVLYFCRDEAGFLQLVQQELARAESQGDRVLIPLLEWQLLESYARQEQAEPWLALAPKVLKQAPEWVRLQVLEQSSWLAERGDPQAMAMIDQWVLKCRQPDGAPRLARALFQRAQINRKLKRPAAALKDLDELAGLPEQVRIFFVSRERAQVLKDLGREAEAVAYLRQQYGSLDKDLSNLDLCDVTQNLVYLLQDRHEEWEPTLESALQKYRSFGPEGKMGSDELLFTWLVALGMEQKWEQGRQILARYPWSLPAGEWRTERLRDFKEWNQLLGKSPAQAAIEVPADGLAAKLDELRLAHPELGQWISLRSTNLGRLRARLQENETLVTYCNVDEDLYVLALRPGDSFWRSSRVNQAQLQRLVSDYLAGLRSDQQGTAEASLYQMLLAPVLHNQKDERLLIVPTGSLWQIPFGALRNPQGESVASRVDLTLLTSGDLLRLADNSWSPYQLSAPLAIGAPNPSDLPGAARELEDVARVLPGCQLRSGSQATLTALQTAKQPWGLVHFAGHAHYNRLKPTESDLELFESNLRLKNLSQLALAEHSLVGLSCCQGGAAAGQNLEEPVTLATGFSVAGAETVIGNLWPVDDEVARIFFTSFYQELAVGGSPRQSFRKAQTLCRQAYPKPRDWGGFFLLGNPT